LELHVIYDRLDALTTRAEARLGAWRWTALLSLLLLGAAALYVRPAVEPQWLGRLYAKLSLDPLAFDSTNPVSFRILTPLISYLLGLRGSWIIVTNLIIAAVFLGAVAAYFRQHAPRPADSAVAALTMTFSLVTLTSVYSGGYCDSLTYLIIFSMWWLRGRSLIFFGLFFLGLLNRETIAFLVPWFAWVSVAEAQRKARKAIAHAAGYAIALGAYFLFRAWVAESTEVRYDLGFYLNPLLADPLGIFRSTAGVQAIGLFSVFKLLWLIPAVAAASLWKRKQRASVAGLFVLLFFTWTQMFFAWDTSRYFTLGFMVMIVSLEHLFATDAYRFREWVVWLIVLNLAVPQLAVTRIVTPMHSLIGNAILVAFFGKPVW
jgi:hypothetical protein